MDRELGTGAVGQDLGSGAVGQDLGSGTGVLGTETENEVTRN